MRLIEAFTGFESESPLKELDPNEKREVDDWMRKGDIDTSSQAFMKLLDFYEDEMPLDVQQGNTGTSDEWIFDKLSQLPEYR